MSKRQAMLLFVALFILPGVVLLTGAHAIYGQMQSGGAATAADGPLVSDPAPQIDNRSAFGQVIGSVTDFSDRAIGQILVSLYSVITNEQGQSTDQLTRRTLTDGQGRYQFPVLPSGRYKVGFADALYPERYLTEYYAAAEDLWNATTVDVAEEPLHIDAQLAPAGSIDGHIINQAGEPLAGIQVTLFQGSNLVYDDFVERQTTKTLADGSYLLTGLPVGTYRIRFAEEQWPPHYAASFYRNATSLTTGTDIVITPGLNRSGIDSQMILASAVTGHATDEQGAPIEDVGVYLYADPDVDGYWTIERSSTTDSNGFYQFDGLHPGAYRLQFIDTTLPPRFQSEFYGDVATVEVAMRVTVGEGALVDGIDIQLSNVGHIKGRLHDALDAPLINATVIAFQLDEAQLHWRRVNSVATDFTGTYDLGGLLAGDYRIGFAYTATDDPVLYYPNATTIEAATDITVQANTTVTHIAGQLSAPASLVGRVTDEAGQPLADIVVGALRYTDDPILQAQSPFIATATTDGDGYYQLMNLAAGTYVVAFGVNMTAPRDYVVAYYDNAPDFTSAQPLTLAVGVIIAGIDAQLARTATVRGVVRDRDGVPVSAISVSALRMISAGWTSFGSALTDAGGAYTLTTLDAGDYLIEFYDGQIPRHYAEVYYGNVADRDAASLLHLTAGAQVNNIDVLISTGSRISGRVTDSQDRPLYDIPVVLYRETPTDVGSLSWEYEGDARTAVDGSYAIPALRAGRYRVGFLPSGQPYQQQYYAHVPTLGEATDLTLDGQQAFDAIDARLLALDDVNAAPVAADDEIVATVAPLYPMIQFDVSNLLLNDSDPNGDLLFIQLVDDAEFGTVALEAGTFINYLPNGPEITDDHFTYVVSDGYDTSNVATVVIHYVPATAAPNRILIPFVRTE